MTDPIEVYVEDTGGPGRPVILIHGWPLSGEAWEKQVPVLHDAGFRVITYDRRGFGRSPKPEDGFDYDTLTADLHGVIERLDLRDVTLVGFSMGGGEVARYMSRHGGQGVTRAALIASVVPFLLKTSDNPDGVDQSVFDDMTKGMMQDRPHFFAGFFKDFFGQGIVSHPVSQERLDWAWAMAMQAGRKPTLACADAFATTDFRPDLPSFTVPTLIIHGTGDKTVPIDTSARQAAAGIARSQLVEYDGAPHGLFATEGERLTNDLLTFLRG